MAGNSSIEWTDATWNPARGCTCVSPGCTKCYAMKIAARFSGPGMAYEGLAAMHPKAGGQWTGKLRLVEEALDAPLRWSTPRRIFVNSMSDLFHEALSLGQIAEVFAVMYLAPRHTFQVLTKRSARMREVLTHPYFYRAVLAAADGLRRTRHALAAIGISDPTRHPAPWVHLGVSVENQKYAQIRVPELQHTPAAVRFLSCEPLLGPTDLDRAGAFGIDGDTEQKIDWVIVGGESGHDARPFDVAWGRVIVEQCRHADVRCFVKQLGANVWQGRGRNRERLELKSKKGNDPAEWPSRLNVREFPRVSDAR